MPRYSSNFSARPTALRASRPNFSGSLSFIDRLPSAPVRSLRFNPYQVGRDLALITTATTRRAGVPKAVPPLSFNRSLLAIEDRRLFHPQGKAAPARGSFRSATQLVVPRSSVSSTRWVEPTPSNPIVPWRKNPYIHSVGEPYAFPNAKFPYSLAFRAPNRMAICLRRSIRRNVLHAFGVAGSVNLRPPKYSEYSRIKC